MSYISRQRRTKRSLHHRLQMENILVTIGHLQPPSLSKPPHSRVWEINKNLTRWSSLLKKCSLVSNVNLDSSLLKTKPLRVLLVDVRNIHLFKFFALTFQQPANTLLPSVTRNLQPATKSLLHFTSLKRRKLWYMKQEPQRGNKGILATGFCSLKFQRPIPNRLLGA